MWYHNIKKYMINKNEKIIIVGKSGSGKDWLLRQLKNEGLRSSVKVTTRPQRQNEEEGVNYYFKSNFEFDNLLKENKFIVEQKFLNNKNELWKYGILMDDFENSQAFIMTPDEIKQIDDEKRKNCFIVYLDIDRKTREGRILHRNDDNDSVIRRLEADEIDFQNFKDYDLKITDPQFEVDMILNLMN